MESLVQRTHILVDGSNVKGSGCALLAGVCAQVHNPALEDHAGCPDACNPLGHAFIPAGCRYQTDHCTMRFGSTAKVLAKCRLKYYRFSECIGWAYIHTYTQTEPTSPSLLLLPYSMNSVSL